MQQFILLGFLILGRPCRPLPNFYGRQAFLHVEGTAQDGAVRIEHIQPSGDAIVLRLLDYSVGNNDKTTLSPKQNGNTVRRIYLVGQTKLTNAEFADPATGKGLVLDVWVSNRLFYVYSP